MEDTKREGLMFEPFSNMKRAVSQTVEGVRHTYFATVDGYVKLIDMPLDDARQVKWQQGVLEHGHTMTLDPLEELFAECLDGINYAKALETDTQLPEAERFYMKFVANQLHGIAISLQTMHADNPKRTYTPQIFPFK